jgi:hypothetical protein
VGSGGRDNCSARLRAAESTMLCECDNGSVNVTLSGMEIFAIAAAAERF